MSLFGKELDDLLNYYDNLNKVFSREYENGPRGSLISQKNHGKDQFLHLFSKDGKQIRKCITKNEAMQRELARKEFARKASHILKQNVDVLRTAINDMIPFDVDEILKSMTKAYGKLPEDYFFDRDRLAINLHLDDEIEARIKRHYEWGRQPYMQSNYKIYQKRHRTSKGLKVRSKSEALICECNYKWYDVPFRYEQIQIIDGVEIFPDFTYEDSKSELFYWEHLGMMDDPGYAELNFRKLRRYYDIGLIPGDNLILSFDRRGDIDMRIIEDILTHQVIPRL